MFWKKRRAEETILARLDRMDKSIAWRIEGLRSAINYLTLNLREIKITMKNELDVILDAIKSNAQVQASALKSLGEDLTQTLADLETKVAAGADFSAEIATAKEIAAGVAAASDAVAAIDKTVKAADPNQPPATQPPASSTGGTDSAAGQTS